MKKMSIYKLMAFLIAATIIIAACTKEQSDVRIDPKLSTSQYFNVKSDSATVVGFVVATGSGFTERGVCYDIAANPTTDKSKVIFTSEVKSATFNVVLSGLSYATKYYARAYAINAGGTIYGEEVSFTTLPIVPISTTVDISSITGNSAAGGGNVTVAGGADVTARGVCYGTGHNPTTSNSKTSDGNGTGAFVSALSGLLGNTVYYVRAYAVNSAGTGYGPEVTFTTLVDLPVVTTVNVTAITKFTAVSGGNVTYDGGGAVTARGIVYGTNPDPTIADVIVAAGTDTGSFVSNLADLTKLTIYHVRAFATNSAGTAYGSDKQFSTLGDDRTWNVPGSYVKTSYPGSTLDNWAPDKSPQVKSTVTNSDHLEGYIYMADASNEWKFATLNNWDGPNYGDGGAGTLSEAGGNIVSPAGYYKINVDASVNPMTYTAVATEWGVIGSATANAWDDETPLTYDPELKKWTGGLHLTAAEFKFRANHSWDYNYGSTAANATLDAGGANIAVTIESDYVFALDLSKPNTYSYTMDRWGLVGSATPGGWDTDQNMTWDNVNKVLTITIDLIAGEIKFRANDAWTVNLGGSVDALTQDGPNIPIATAGNYTFTLDLKTSKTVITKN